MNFQAIAQRYGVTIAEAELLRAHVDREFSIDWSEASYKEIDQAMHLASCALFNRAIATAEERARRKEGMKQFRARLLKAHKKIIATVPLETGDMEFQRSIVACIEDAQRKFGEA